jgi:hypothetical protein
MPKALAVLLALVVSTAVSASAQTGCGTGGHATARTDSIARWVRATQSSTAAKVAQPLAAPAVRENVIVFPADDGSAPFRRPFALGGRSLVFTPITGGYSAANIALTTDDGTATALPLNSSSPRYAQHDLGFTFPFGARSITRIYVAENNAIYLDAPAFMSDVSQFTELELATMPSAVIAPLLMQPGTVAATPAVTVRDASDHVAVNWIASAGTSRYNVQAALFRDGTIRFSYRQADNVPAASLVVTSGNESWRSKSTAIRDAVDATGDTTGVSAVLAPMLDISSASVTRIDDLDLIEFRITLAHAIDRSLLTTENALYTIDTGNHGFDQTIELAVHRDGADELTIPVVGWVGRSAAARIEGQTIVIDILQDFLPPPLSDMPITITSRYGRTIAPVDSLTMTATFGAPQRTVRTAFESASAPLSLIDVPIAEAFTLPIFNPDGAWDELKRTYLVNDASFDAVLFYLNFDSDLALTGTVAYSTSGNPRADGISTIPLRGQTFPLVPELIYLGAIGAPENQQLKAATYYSLHEFAHRWLFYVAFNDAGTLSHALNPDGAHAAQWVSTAAAFPVYALGEASVMGGGIFAENGNAFTTPPQIVSNGYSWLDLYLMGLAGVDEVPAWFYLENSTPPLATFTYWPQPGKTFTATKKTVNVQQVIDVMGPRLPAYPAAPHDFKALFVLLTAPGTSATDADIATVQRNRADFEAKFRLATGARGTVSTAFVPAAPISRRRAVRP